ncbi:serine hydrolase [Actinoplanes sp. Pm04-4]|uniref:Serine hydrolase n=1 Tax=Paractinoplanes pyxinae TaxID=2997416 RepID=A0ABT4ARV2_9ACTN|nr:serine hydrolase [Actinoplanes pyxinae]MCY1136979.1 serine hydrolase [Actinoplanes pyxinae]
MRVRGLVAAALICALTACSDSPPAPDPTAPTAPRAAWPTTGWPTAAPRTQGVDPAALARFDQQVGDVFTEVRSVLVVRHGYVVHERYWHGLTAASGHDVRSVTKSFVATLVGIALGEGKIKSLDQTVGELLAAPRSALAGVTVRHLLTMTAGLAGDPAGEDDLWASPDWVRQILGRRLIAEPGVRFQYSSASSHLLAAIVARATGRTVLDYAREKLFTPLGIDTTTMYEPRMGGAFDPDVDPAYTKASVAWPVDPQGIHCGGGFLRLPTRELAKLGYLYLNGGRWEGRQVVPAAFVDAATRPTGLPPDVLTGYGLHWWIDDDGAGQRSFTAVGYGGQYIAVVPERDLVVVVTNNPEGPPDPGSLLSGTILPGVT